MQNIYKVHPIISDRSGEAVRNQYAIEIPEGWAFQSYDSLIAIYNSNENTLTLGRYFDYSVTTSKYLRKFLQEYARPIYRNLPDGKSLKDTLNKAIRENLIQYNEAMY